MEDLENARLKRELKEAKEHLEGLRERVRVLEALCEMSCENPCGDCAGCLYAAEVHDE